MTDQPSAARRLDQKVRTFVPVDVYDRLCLYALQEDISIAKLVRLALCEFLGSPLEDAEGVWRLGTYKRRLPSPKRDRIAEPMGQRAHDKKWSALRRVMLERTGHKCQHCTAEETSLRREESWLEVHHIVSVKNEERRLDPSNLVVLCRECHDFVHGRANVNRLYLPPL